MISCKTAVSHLNRVLKSRYKIYRAFISSHSDSVVIEHSMDERINTGDIHLRDGEMVLWMAEILQGTYGRNRKGLKKMGQAMLDWLIENHRGLRAEGRHHLWLPRRKHG